MNETIIKVSIPCNGNEDVYYFKPKNKIETYKYVDSLYYNDEDDEHRIGYRFRDFLFSHFNGWYTKEQINFSMIEFITDIEIEEIDF